MKSLRSAEYLGRSSGYSTLERLQSFYPSKPRSRYCERTIKIGSAKFAQFRPNTAAFPLC